jgi:hypothetical protein
MACDVFPLERTSMFPSQRTCVFPSEETQPVFLLERTVFPIRSFSEHEMGGNRNKDNYRESEAAHHHWSAQPSRSGSRPGAHVGGGESKCSPGCSQGQITPVLLGFLKGGKPAHRCNGRI